LVCSQALKPGNGDNVTSVRIPGSSAYNGNTTCRTIVLLYHNTAYDEVVRASRQHCKLCIPALTRNSTVRGAAAQT
jgi:hypothetical protein